MPKAPGLGKGGGCVDEDSEASFCFSPDGIESADAATFSGLRMAGGPGLGGSGDGAIGVSVVAARASNAEVDGRRVPVFDY